MLATMKRVFLVLAIFLLATGCVTTPQPQYVDPLVSLGNAPGNPAFSNHKLGVLLSGNVKASMSHMEGARSFISSFGAFTNTTALTDADPQFVVEGINKILNDRFKEVIVIKDIDEAAINAVGVAMILDMQIHLGPQSGEQTTVKISGIFVDPDETEVARVTGNGASTVPWPASSHMFKPAASAALVQFATRLDDSTQLETALKTLKPATYAATASSGTNTNFPVAPVNVSFAASPPRPDDIAVIIGNADYGKLGKDIPNVIPAYADAESFKKYVLTELGVREGNIIDLRDATSAQLERVFGSERTFKGQLYDWVRQGQSRVWIYYSGHGAPAGNNNAAY
ncbi:MAG: caspase family protein, partial [Alphaproteobacteria bacterium]|nr:caspase family protein [Alphaproteobacteria bacterium]